MSFISNLHYMLQLLPLTENALDSWQWSNHRIVHVSLESIINYLLTISHFLEYDFKLNFICLIFKCTTILGIYYSICISISFTSIQVFLTKSTKVKCKFKNNISHHA